VDVGRRERGSGEGRPRRPFDTILSRSSPLVSRSKRSSIHRDRNNELEKVRWWTVSVRPSDGLTLTS
jgi:hypothetical protein